MRNQLYTMLDGPELRKIIREIVDEVLAERDGDKQFWEDAAAGVDSDRNRQGD